MTSAQFTILVQDLLINNVTEQITPEDMRTLMLAIRDSYYNKDDATLNSLLIDDAAKSTTKTYSSQKIEQLLSALATVTRTVASIADRNGLPNLKDGENVYVESAIDDPTVKAGWAIYKYVAATISWIKIAEQESIDLVIPPSVQVKDGVVSGFASVMGFPTQSIAPGRYNINSVGYRINDTTEITHSAADPVHDRIDVVYATTNSTLVLLEGFANATPVKPVIPANTVEINFTIVGPLGSTTTTRTNIEISDVNRLQAELDLLAALDKIVPANRYDANFLGEIVAGTTRWWQAISILSRKINAFPASPTGGAHSGTGLDFNVTYQNRTLTSTPLVINSFANTSLGKRLRLIVNSPNTSLGTVSIAASSSTVTGSGFTQALVGRTIRVSNIERNVVSVAADGLSLVVAAFFSASAISSVAATLLDSFSINVSGWTVRDLGFSFLAGVPNIVELHVVDTSTYELFINPLV